MQLQAPAPPASLAGTVAGTARRHSRLPLRSSVCLMLSAVRTGITPCERVFARIRAHARPALSTGRSLSFGADLMAAACCSFQQGRHVIIPLHSTIAPEDQRRAFVSPAAGVRKVVVSTNIAETSVTIEDVVYVIDSGKLKERRFNAARGISMLVLDHVSQASARQRKGRAGRVREGKCYSLFTRDCHDARMAPFQVPEIMRVPLEELVLQIHLLELGRAAEFLPEALQPPPDKAVTAAVTALHTLGALDEDERLTPLGTYLAQLPVDPRLGKLLVTSVFMGCLSAAVTIAACLSYKAPFSTAFAVPLPSPADVPHSPSCAYRWLQP